MSKKYSIWDKKSYVITPAGHVFTPEQWIEKYPVAGVDGIVIVGSAGAVNGGLFGILANMIQMCEAQGADFSACTTPEEALEVIEAFEDEMNSRPVEPTPEERQAQALEAIAEGATSETTAAMEALLNGEG